MVFDTIILKTKVKGKVLFLLKPMKTRFDLKEKSDVRTWMVGRSAELENTRPGSGCGLSRNAWHSYVAVLKTGRVCRVKCFWFA